jgi:hypothetical protein
MTDPPGANEVAHHVATYARLDIDDVRPHIAQEHSARRAHVGMCPFNNPNSR